MDTDIFFFVAFVPKRVPKELPLNEGPQQGFKNVTNELKNTWP